MLEYHFEHAEFVEPVLSASSNSVVLMLNIMPPAKTCIFASKSPRGHFFDHSRSGFHFLSIARMHSPFSVAVILLFMISVNTSAGMPDSDEVEIVVIFP